MKYLKKFETIDDNSLMPVDSKFKIGDYVTIKFGCHPQYRKQMFIVTSYDERSDLWKIDSLIDDGLFMYWNPKNLRKLRPEEIKDFKIKIDAIKYNL